MLKHSEYKILRKKADSIILADECASMMDSGSDGAYSGLTEEEHQIIATVQEYEDFLNKGE